MQGPACDISSAAPRPDAAFCVLLWYALTCVAALRSLPCGSGSWAIDSQTNETARLRTFKRTAPISCGTCCDTTAASQPLHTPCNPILHLLPPRLTLSLRLLSSCTAGTSFEASWRGQYAVRTDRAGRRGASASGRRDVARPHGIVKSKPCVCLGSISRSTGGGKQVIHVIET